MTILDPDIDAGEIVVEVGGKPYAPVDRTCSHSSFGSSVVVADVFAPDGSLDHREARLRLRCMECGVPCEIETTGRPPADGGPGVVVTFRPLPSNPEVPSPQDVPIGGPNAG